MRTKAERQADTAYTTLLAYQTYSGADKSTFDVEETAKQFLVDLMHLSKEYAFTVEEVLKEARGIFEEAQS